VSVLKTRDKSSALQPEQSYGYEKLLSVRATNRSDLLPGEWLLSGFHIRLFFSIGQAPEVRVASKTGGNSLPVPASRAS
jgi:hypothetical protein